MHRNETRPGLKRWLQSLMEPDVLPLWIVFALILSGVGYALWLIGSYAAQTISGWDMAIRLTVIGLVGSVFYPFINKRIEKRSEFDKMVLQRRLETYEEIAKYIFTWQKRTGYLPPDDPQGESADKWRVNRLVMLWASDPIAESWREYLTGEVVYSKSLRDGRVDAVGRLFDRMRCEIIGRRVDKVSWDFRSLRFWFGGQSFILGSDESSGLI